MKDLFIDIIGTYTSPSYSSVTSEGAIINVIPAGVAGIDVPWVLSCVFFIVFFYCVCRFIGGLFK